MQHRGLIRYRVKQCADKISRERETFSTDDVLQELSPEIITNKTAIGLILNKDTRFDRLVRGLYSRRKP